MIESFSIAIIKGNRCGVLGSCIKTVAAFDFQSIDYVRELNAFKNSIYIVTLIMCSYAKLKILLLLIYMFLATMMKYNVAL